MKKPLIHFACVLVSVLISFGLEAQTPLSPRCSGTFEVNSNASCYSDITLLEIRSILGRYGNSVIEIN